MIEFLSDRVARASKSINILRVPILEKSRNLRAEENVKLRARPLRNSGKKRIGIVVIIDFRLDPIPLPRIRERLILTRLKLGKSSSLRASVTKRAPALNRPMDDDDATLLTTRCPITRLLSPDTRNIARN